MHRFAIWITGVPLLFAASALAAPERVEVRPSAGNDVSPPLRLMPIAAPSQEKDHPVMTWRHRSHAMDPVGTDPVIDRGPNGPLVPAPGLLWQFMGVGQGFVNTDGSTVSDSVAPPDTNGDIGPDHYISLVNLEFAVFDKDTNKVLYGSVPTNTLFQGFTGGGGVCASTNSGDGVVLYDPLSDRWIISQLGIDLSTLAPPYFECVAVSTTGDPTGQWNRYAFGPYKIGSDDGFNDYPKMGVWPDGYYITYNIFDETQGFIFSGSKLCALDRTRMLAGQPATEQCFQLATQHGGVIPIDFDGPPTQTPAAGSPGLFVGYDAFPDGGTELDLWRLQVNWANPSSTTLNGSTAAPFNPVLVSGAAHFFEGTCQGGATITCVPEPTDGQGTLLDTLGDRMMFRASYRKLTVGGGYESILATHTVMTTAADTNTGVRWYEIRNPFAASPSVYQQGTVAPDLNWRWMGAIAQDKFGDIGLGYSISSPLVEPGIRYTAHAPTDALGAMETEQTLFTGVGQNGGLNRWGDYSDMVVDPVDDCTFWYTQEYLAVAGSFNWSTRVGAFRFPGCLAIAKLQLTGPTTATAGTAVSYTVKAVDRSGTTLPTYSGTASISSTDPGVTAATVSIANGTGSFSVTFTKAGAQTLTVADQTNPLLRAIDTVTVSAGPPSQYILAGIPAAITAGQAATFNATAQDKYGNLADQYAGSARVSSTDARAVVPANATFAAGAVSNLSVIFAKAGTQSVILTDGTNPALKGSAQTVVGASVFAAYGVTGLGATVGPNVVNPLTITAEDTYGNPVVAYSGSAALTTTDPQATLPASNPTFASGVASNVNVTFKTPGKQSLTVQDATGLPVSTTVDTFVTAGAPAKYAIVGLPTTLQAGVQVVVDIIAQDANGGQVTAYSGTAKLTSTDGKASVPASVPFVQGLASTVPLVFGTPGQQSITATDSASATLTGSGSLTITAGRATRYLLTGLPNPVQPNTATSFNITAADLYGNTASSYVGKAKISSTDPQATVPNSPVSFTAGVASNVPVTLSTNGLQFVEATDSVDSTITGEAATDVGGTAQADGGLPAPKLKSGCGCGSTEGSTSALWVLLGVALLGARRRLTGS